VVELIPKKTAREIPLKNVLLVAAGILLAASVLGYAALLRLEAKTLLSIQDLEENIFKIGARNDKIIESKVFDAEAKIEAFKSLWVGRRKIFNFFGNFNGLVHPKVWFSFFEFNPTEASAVVSGHTLNFETLEQQRLFLKNKSDLVESVNLSDIGFADKGGVEFRLNINFTPKIFEASED